MRIRKYGGLGEKASQTQLYFFTISSK